MVMATKCLQKSIYEKEAVGLPISNIRTSGINYAWWCMPVVNASAQEDEVGRF